MKTPPESCRALAAALGLPQVFLKREDLHHYGSHKGRSIPYMINVYHKRQGTRDFVISSSGNAALAAALMVINHNANNPADKLSLKIFIGKKIAADKFKLLARETKKDAHVALFQVDRPKRQAFQTTRTESAQMLRQSTDELALVGYHELAKELLRIPNLQAVFVPTSSGTTAQALGEAFVRLSARPQVHIVQTSVCHPIAAALGAFAPMTEMAKPEVLDDNDEPPASPLAGAIVDKVALRKAAVVAAVQATDGAGWIVADDEIKAAIELTKKTTRLAISGNSALSVAGLTQALKRGKTFSGAVACLITGR